MPTYNASSSVSSVRKNVFQLPTCTRALKSFRVNPFSAASVCLSVPLCRPACLSLRELFLFAIVHQTKKYTHTHTQSHTHDIDEFEEGEERTEDEVEKKLLDIPSVRIHLT